jgi:hypothetical protein
MLLALATSCYDGGSNSTSALDENIIAVVDGMCLHIDDVRRDMPAGITDADSVNKMIWALFSIFPAIIAGIMMGLLYIYPIKK